MSYAIRITLLATIMLTYLQRIACSASCCKCISRQTLTKPVRVLR